MNEKQVRALAATGRFRGRILHASMEQTHISWILLTGRFAFKLKKPLKLSFLDFSTLAKRKKYCEKELKLNRRFSDIYLDVLPVAFDHAWYLGSNKGKIADYTVQMKRMMTSKRMDLLLANGKVRKAHILQIAKTIGEFHQRADVIRAPFDMNFEQRLFNDLNVIRIFTLKTLGKKYASIITGSMKWSDAFLRANRKRIRERIDRSFRRDGHGDLHSGNIFLYRHPVIFDCIEFNDRYRHIDVLNEIAFFCMDLESFGRKRFAEFFLKEYTKWFPCMEVPADENLFNYYKCYRANVRAKVFAIAAAQEDGRSEGFHNHVKALKKYLQMMEGYCSHL